MNVLCKCLPLVAKNKDTAGPVSFEMFVSNVCFLPGFRMRKHTSDLALTTFSMYFRYSIVLHTQLLSHYLNAF